MLDQQLYYCESYSASNTSDATQNSVICFIYACANEVVEISNCGTATGDTFMRLWSTAYPVAELANNDNNPECSNNVYSSYISYSIPSGVGCGLYAVVQGCSGSSACSAQAFTYYEVVEQGTRFRIYVFIFYLTYQLCSKY